VLFQLIRLFDKATEVHVIRVLRCISLQRAAESINRREHHIIGRSFKLAAKKLKRPGEEKTLKMAWKCTDPISSHQMNRAGYSPHLTAIPFLSSGLRRFL
jgi:hypothetical protein